MFCWRRHRQNMGVLSLDPLIWILSSGSSHLDPLIWILSVGAALRRQLAGDRQKSVSELAKPFQMTLPAVSKHLKVLAKAGLIERSRDAQWRPCKLRAAPLKDASKWIEQYRQFWEERFDRLDDYLKKIQAKEKSRDESD